MSVCFTGHREIHGMYFKVPIEATNIWTKVWERLITIVTALYYNKQEDTFIAGGALGFDTMAAMAVLHCRYQLNMPLKLILALPFNGFENKWLQQDKNLLYAIMTHANSTLYVNDVLNKPNPIPDKRKVAIVLQDRNEYMVNSSSYIIGMYIPDKVGGTLNCIRYVMSLRKSFCLLNPDTLNISTYQWNFNKATYHINTITKDQPISIIV